MKKFNTIQGAIWTCLIFMFMMASACSDSSPDPNPSDPGLGTVASCEPSMPLPYDMVLWHEGYSTHKTMSSSDLNTYLESLMDFVDPVGFNTVFITVPTFIQGDDSSVVAELKSFIDTLAVKGIGIGIQFGLSNGDSDSGWFDYTEVSSVVGDNDYILGLDSENYNYQGETIKAANTMDFINSIKQQITDAGGPMPTDIAVAGGAGYNSADGWASPLVNVFEYYSSPAGLNGVLSVNVNDPTTAFNQCIDSNFFKNPTAAGGGIQGGTAKGWPAFSFEQTGDNCLAGSFGKVNNTCGSFDILGGWELNCVMEFMTLFKEKYYTSSEKPTFVLYQSDFLPCDWLPNGCP